MKGSSLRSATKCFRTWGFGYAGQRGRMPARRNNIRSHSSRPALRMTALRMPSATRVHGGLPPGKNAHGRSASGSAHGVSWRGMRSRGVPMIALEPLLHQHAQRFGAAERAFQAPGRVNLIGEHTDYTGGLVMPAAIDFNTIAVVGPAKGGRSIIHSVDFKKEFEFDAGALPEKPKHEWTDYPVGVLWSLRQSGVMV